MAGINPTLSVTKLNINGFTIQLKDRDWQNGI